MDENKAWFESLFLNNPIPRFIFNSQSLKIEKVNPAAIEQYGYTEQEFLTKTLYDLRSKDEYDQLKEVLSTLGDKDVYVGEVKHLKKNGEVIWVQISAHPIVYNGLPARSIQALNITEKKIAETKISQSEAILRAVFDSAVEGFVITDKDLIIQTFNKVAKHHSFSNTKRHELVVGTSLLDYVSPARIDFFKGMIPRIMDGENFEYKAFDQHDGGRWINFCLYPVQNASKEIIGICIAGKDVTERIDFEDQLKLSEQRYKALIKEGSDLINIIDLDGNYKFITPATKSNLDPRAIGENAFQYVHEDDREKLKEELGLLRNLKRIKSSPYRFKIADGKYLWMETVGTNLMDEPAVQGIVINSHEVTDTVNHIKAIEERNTRLEEIAWIHAHLVRAPLASILGIIEILKTSRTDFDELMPYLEQSAVQLDKVIGEITQKTNDLTT